MTVATLLARFVPVPWAEPQQASTPGVRAGIMIATDLPLGEPWSWRASLHPSLLAAFASCFGRFRA